MTHTLEILVMLGVALLLGALLYFLATREQRRRLRALTTEVTQLRAQEATLSQRLATAEENLTRARDDLAATARVLAHQHDIQSHEPQHHEPQHHEPVHHEPPRHDPDPEWPHQDLPPHRPQPPATMAGPTGSDRAPPGNTAKRDEPRGVQPIPAAN